MELQSNISLSINEARIGTTERVIIDSFTDGVLVGRSMSESPEVDGEILIAPNATEPNSLIGTFVNVKITDASDFDLYAVVTNDSNESVN